MHSRQTLDKEPGIRNRSNWFGRRTGTTGTPSELSWFACLDALGAVYHRLPDEAYKEFLRGPGTSKHNLPSFGGLLPTVSGM